MQLTDEQLRAIEEGRTIAVDVNGHKCAVMLWDQYERATEHISPRATAALIRATMSEDDADDPLLDSYQKYRSKP